MGLLFEVFGSYLIPQYFVAVKNSERQMTTQPEEKTKRKTTEMQSPMQPVDQEHPLGKR